MEKFKPNMFPDKGYGYHVILMTKVCNKPYVQYFEEKESLETLPEGTIIIAANATVPIYIRHK